MALAARYVPAGADMAVGGDWYDVVELPAGTSAWPSATSPATGCEPARPSRQPAAGAGDRHARVPRVLDLDSGTVRFANAGHPPPLALGPGGQTAYLEDGLGPPLGCDEPGLPAEARFRLAPDSTLLLFTDGLVEERGRSIHEGLERLAALAAASGQDLEALCEQLLRSMVKDDTADPGAHGIRRAVGRPTWDGGADAPPHLERERVVSDLARVEGERQGPICLVRVHGEIDLSNAQEVSSAIGSAMGHEARQLVVDLSDITYLDSSGVALLLRPAARLQARRRQLHLVVPRGSPVRRVLVFTGLPKVIPVEARLDEALAHLDGGPPDGLA
jgi:anti-anti-sigma factor